MSVSSGVSIRQGAMLVKHWWRAKAFGTSGNTVGSYNPSMADQVRDQTFDVGDRVRIDIPDETHPDHPHHGKNGEIIAEIPGDSRNDRGGRQLRVALDIGDVVDVRPFEVRPPI
jgi:hypothetical protein